MNVYMVVSEDKYELPLALADTVDELAEIINVNSNSIFSALSKFKHGKIKFSRYVKVEIDDDIL